MLNAVFSYANKAEQIIGNMANIKLILIERYSYIV